jgi:hypothetical protein
MNRIDICKPLFFILSICCTIEICAQKIKSSVYDYTVTAMPGWRKTEIGDADIALKHPQGGMLLFQVNHDFPKEAATELAYVSKDTLEKLIRTGLFEEILNRGSKTALNFYITDRGLAKTKTIDFYSITGKLNIDGILFNTRIFIYTTFSTTFSVISLVANNSHSLQLVKESESIVSSLVLEPESLSISRLIRNFEKFSKTLDSIVPYIFDTVSTAPIPQMDAKFPAREPAQVQIKLPPPTQVVKNTVPIIDDKVESDGIFTLVEREAAYPGGASAWREFITGKAVAIADSAAKRGIPPGTYTIIIQFTIDKNGVPGDFKPVSNVGYGLEEECIKALKLSKKWTPAEQEGKKVKAWKRQPFTFQILEDAED